MAIFYFTIEGKIERKNHYEAVDYLYDFFKNSEVKMFAVDVEQE